MKRSLHLLFLFLPLVMLVSQSCDDIIEHDISKKSVSLVAPQDSFQTNTLTQTFWWNEVEYALSYNLQIVSPDFNSVQTLVLDTTIQLNKFTFTFSTPGKYSWRVKALNNESSTEYAGRYMVIDSTLDLSSQLLVLTSPSDNFISNQSNFTFHWNALYNADSYRIQLVEVSSSLLTFDTTTSLNSITLDLDTGTFYWKVRAENDLSVSPYSFRTITVDQSSPAVSVIVAPGLSDTVSSPVTLQWDRSPDVLYDSLFVYSDSSLTVRVVASSVSDTFYDFSGTAFHRYYWRLKSIDQAGNVSDQGNLSNFFIQ